MSLTATSSSSLRHLPARYQCRRAFAARYFSSSSSSSTSTSLPNGLPPRTTALSSTPKFSSGGVDRRRRFTSGHVLRSGMTNPTPLDVNLTEGEQEIHKKLSERFNPAQLKVQDVSGGCGTFYGILISSKEFAGKSTVQQHKLVQEAIKREIEGIHGLQIKTIPE